MVSSESVAPVRFIWVRYQPELTLPDPFRDQIRVFGADFDLSEACILASEQPIVSWPHTMCLGHTQCGLPTVPLCGNHTVRVCVVGGRHA